MYARTVCEYGWSGCMLAQCVNMDGVDVCSHSVWIRMEGMYANTGCGYGWSGCMLTQCVNMDGADVCSHSV